MASFFSSLSSLFGGQAGAGSSHPSTRSRTLTSTHDAFSLPTHSPVASSRDSPDPRFSYPPPAAYSPSPTSYDYMPQSTRDNFRRSTLNSPNPSTLTTAAIWDRLRRFLDREYPELGDTLNYGIAPAVLDQIEAEIGMTLPRAVRDSYLQCDGQEAESGTACAEGLFYGLTLMPLEEALEEWKFWREVDEDPTTGANPQLLQVMASIPPGWIRKAYSCRGWLPLVTDKAGNYLGVDLAPAEEGTYGQVIVFGRDFDTKVVMFRGEGEDGWTNWLASFIEELESGDGYEVGANDSASDGSDDIGYESYFYDGSGRSKGVGGARDGAPGMKLAGEYKGWNVLEAFADRSYRRWRERDMAPDLDAVYTQEPAPQTVQLVGPSMGTGSGVEVPIPVASGSLASPGPSSSKPGPPTPTISVTRAAPPAPLLLPTESDIVPPTAERGFASDDVESGMGMGMDSREVVPLREVTREDSLDSTVSEHTAVGVSQSDSKATTPTTSAPPPVIVAEPETNLLDAPASTPLPLDESVALTPTPISPVAPTPLTEENANATDEKEEADGELPPTTIRLVGTNSVATAGTPPPQHVDSDNDSRASLDLTKEEREERKKKRFSKGLAKLGLKGGKRKEETAV
ncbi:SMI1/KNR4 family containing protein [Ceratobasidium sp. AG-Ba]|nr:SMI1/KNR4 family containing protein [Ceratobasidium sp. AG-Ba]